MSGPKDYDYRLSDGLIAMLNARQNQLREALNARVQANIRRRPMPRKQADERAETVTDIVEVDSERVRKQKQADKQAQQEREKFEQVCSEIKASMESLSQEDSLMSLCKDKYSLLETRYCELIKLEPSDEAIDAAQNLKEEKDKLIEHALDLSAKRERQKEVQQAIVESFHAIGFFTEIQEKNESSDPEQPSTIVARKGKQSVKVSLPLGDSPVKSNWQGQTDERCVDSFFDYVEQMGKRGVDCRAVRKDLHARPRLRQQGKKDLPQSRTKGRQ